MVTVYVLTEDYRYEGEVVQGVYSTEEKAQAARSTLEAEERLGVGLVVHEVELDSAPQDYWPV